MTPEAPVVQCMGGWCQKRDKCQHYLAKPIAMRPPVERLCGKLDEPETIKAVAE